MRFLQIILLLLAPLALAQDAIHKRLATLMPEGFSVAQTPMEGLYEVTSDSDNSVFYMSADGAFLLRGDLIDINAGKNLTAETKAKLHAGVLAGLDDSFISFGKEDAPHRAIVFTDVRCGYCRRFHAGMDKMNELGIAVDYVLSPVLGQKSADQAQAVWCSGDRAQALTQAKLGQEVASKTCSTPIDANLSTMGKLGARGTPAVFHPNGAKLGGYMEPEQLLGLLQKEKS